jgi:hypothetical protein
MGVRASGSLLSLMNWPIHRELETRTPEDDNGSVSLWLTTAIEDYSRSSI